MTDGQQTKQMRRWTDFCSEQVSSVPQPIRMIVLTAYPRDLSCNSRVTCVHVSLNMFSDRRLLFSLALLFK